MLSLIPSNAGGRVDEVDVALTKAFRHSSIRE